jgi:hypothetical protein
MSEETIGYEQLKIFSSVKPQMKEALQRIFPNTQ